MKLTVSVRELRTALAICAQVPVQKDGSKKEIPRNILLQRDGERLKVSASNAIDGVSCAAWISIGSAHTEVRILLSAVALIEICKYADEETIDIEWSDTGDAVVQAGFNEWRLPQGDPATFAVAEINMPNGSPTLVVDGATLIKLLGSVRHAVAVEAARLVMTSVLLTTRNGLNCVATDGRQLAVATHDQFAAPADISCLIPHQALPLLRLEDEDAVSILVSKSHVVFWVTREGVLAYEVACAQVSGRFPDYMAVIPAENKLGFAYQHESRALLAAINKVAFLVTGENASDENKYRVQFDHSPGKLEVKSVSGAGAAKVVVSCECSAESTIKFNYMYLRNALKEINGPVTLYISKPNLPMVLKSEGLLQLIMPLS